MDRLRYAVKIPGAFGHKQAEIMARFPTFAQAVEYMHGEAQKAIASGEHYTAYVSDGDLDQTVSILTVQSRRAAFDAYIKDSCTREVKG